MCPASPVAPWPLGDKLDDPLAMYLVDVLTRSLVLPVRWPDAAGTVTRYTGVLANYEVTLREGDPSPRYRR